MKNVKSIFAVFVLFLLFSFSHNDMSPKVGIKLGETAPGFTIDDTLSGKFDLSSAKGKYVVLNFWASYDANSRISNIRFNNEISRINKDDVRFVSISFDPNENVYRETVRLDGVDTNTQFYDNEGESSGIYRNFRLQKGFGNYLIDPQGVIIAKNFSPEKLTKLISQ